MLGLTAQYYRWLTTGNTSRYRREVISLQRKRANMVDRFPGRSLFALLTAIILLIPGCTRNSIGLFGERIDPIKVDEPADSPPTVMIQGPYPTQVPLIAASNTFLGYMREAAASPTSNANAAMFLKSGIALSDRLCLSWFEQLGQAQARSDVALDNLASLGALSATLLGLASVDSKIIGGVAAAFLFGKQVLNADVAHYILAADLGTVKGAIVTKRSEMAKTLIATTTSSDLDFWTAERLLIDYDDQCSHLAIKKYVSDAVAKATVSPPPSNPSQVSGPAPATAARRRFFVPQVTSPLQSRTRPAELPSSSSRTGLPPVNPNTVGSGYLLDPR